MCAVHDAMSGRAGAGPSLGGVWRSLTPEAAFLRSGIATVPPPLPCRGDSPQQRSTEEPTMAMEPPAEPPLEGCMECKAPRPYTVKAWPNGNTTWHCTVCSKVLRLVPGTYSDPDRSDDAD